MATPTSTRNMANEISEKLPQAMQKEVPFTIAIACGQGVHTVMYILVLGSLAFSLNEMETGDKEDANKQSQMWFTGCIIAKELVGIWSAEILAKSTAWFGRKSILRLCMVLGVVLCGICLSANLMGLEALYLPAMALVGLSTPLNFISAAFVADISTPSKSMRNMATSSAIIGVFVFLGFTLNIPLVEVLPVLYCVAAFMAVVGIGCFSYVGDLSPPKEKRQKANWIGMLKTLALGPCASCRVLYEQTDFTKTIMWFFVMVNAYLASNGSWFYNYLLENFELSSVETNTILSVLFLAISGVTACAAMLPPSLIAMLAGAVSLLVSIFVMAIAGKTLAIFLLGLALSLAAGLIGPIGMVIYMGQQPPSQRDELLGAVKLFTGFFNIIATVVGGGWTATWLDEKEKGNDYLPPCWASLPWTMFGVGFLLYSFCFKNEDKKLYGSKGDEAAMQDEGAEIATAREESDLPTLIASKEQDAGLNKEEKTVEEKRSWTPFAPSERRAGVVFDGANGSPITPEPAESEMVTV